MSLRQHKSVTLPKRQTVLRGGVSAENNDIHTLIAQILLVKLKTKIKKIKSQSQEPPGLTSGTTVMTNL